MLSAWESEYRAALRNYVLGADESGLHFAYELGRKALEAKLSLLDVVAIQSGLLAELTRDYTAGESGWSIDRVREFFIESLSPFEMTQRGYEEANEKLLRWKHVFEHAGWGMVIVDPDGSRVEALNPAFARMHACPPGELVGRRFADLFSPEARDPLRGHLARALREGHLAFESAQLRKDGTTFPAALDATAVRDPDGRVLYLAINIQDVTERKRDEAALEAARAAAESANRELESFSYSVAHDLRAPLRTVTGFAQILLEDHRAELSGDAQRLLKMVTDGAQRMSDLINDLLDLARAGRAALHPTGFDMTDLAQEVSRELLATSPGRKIDLRIGALGRAWGDRSLLRQVLSNLISNAIKYTGRREEAVIDIGGALGPVENTYWVKDNGAGFDMAYADKLFGVFQRLHSREEFEGTGVGLALVQRIIHRHGGRIWGQGVVDGGATFTFTLPKEGGTS